MCVFNGTEIKSILIDKGISELYHANSVLTSATFFSVGGLLSRGAVENRRLQQTPQQTDQKDGHLGIWNDIFFDSCDIHERAHNLNCYGPVCFVFSIDLLEYLALPDIKITKQNPQYWDENIKNNRYINDINEYQKNDFGMHLTLIDTFDIIPFNPYLKKIILDNPNLNNNQHFINARDFIANQIRTNDLNCELLIRECDANCNCHKKYKSYNSGAIWHKFKTK